VGDSLIVVVGIELVSGGVFWQVRSVINFFFKIGGGVRVFEFFFLNFFVIIVINFLFFSWDFLWLV
jgi:hypothetical protein